MCIIKTLTCIIFQATMNRMLCCWFLKKPSMRETAAIMNYFLFAGAIQRMKHGPAGGSVQKARVQNLVLTERMLEKLLIAFALTSASSKILFTMNCLMTFI